jgi:hypothetical protein
VLLCCRHARPAGSVGCRGRDPGSGAHNDNGRPATRKDGGAPRLPRRHLPLPGVCFKHPWTSLQCTPECCWQHVPSELQCTAIAADSLTAADYLRLNTSSCMHQMGDGIILNLMKTTAGDRSSRHCLNLCVDHLLKKCDKCAKNCRHNAQRRFA